MRILLIMFFVALYFPMNGEEYRYFDKKISEEKFADFYHYFKNYLFVDNDGKVYDIQRDLTCYNSPNIISKIIVPLISITTNSEIGDYGVVDGKIIQIVDSQKIIVDINPRLLSWVTVNTPTKGMYDGQRFTSVGIIKRTYSYISVAGARRTLPEIDLLDTLTISAFKKYIENNPLIFYKKTFETIPTKTKTCFICQGKKRIKNPEFNKKSIDSKSYIDCPHCRGTGLEIKQKEKKREIFEQCIVDLDTKLPDAIKQ